MRNSCKKILQGLVLRDNKIFSCKICKSFAVQFYFSLNIFSLKSYTANNDMFIYYWHFNNCEEWQKLAFSNSNFLLLLLAFSNNNNRKLLAVSGILIVSVLLFSSIAVAQ